MRLGSQFAAVKLELNEASAQELALLPGVGPALAARIVENRRDRGKFVRVEDVDRVSGIGPVVLERIRPFVTVARLD